MRGIITEDVFIDLSKDFHDERGRLERLMWQTQEEIDTFVDRMK